jgi:hypothetical protein
MSFTDAYKEMLAGKKIRRPGFKGYWFINPENGIFAIHLANDKEINYGKLDLTVKNCAANDWEVVDE